MVGICGKLKRKNDKEMVYEEYIQLAWNNIKKRKLRTGLTVLGIVIAITSIVALISIGNGLEAGISQQFDKIGTNRIYVTIKGSSLQGFQTGLEDEHVEALKTLKEAEWINPYLLEQATVEYNKKKKIVTIWATKTDNLEKRWADIDFDMEKGRLFFDNEKYSVILGYKAATELFDKEIKLGENLLINNKKFKVIGVFEEIGNEEDDNVIELPLETAQTLFGRGNDITMIEVVVKDGVNIDDVAKKAKAMLDKRFGKDIFDIVTPDQLMQQFTTVTTVINVILGAIAGISLVVGGIGIMNTMYTSVLERKKEIGIMKALGAKNKDIFALFLCESGIIGFMSGVIGGLIGFCIAKSAEFAAEAIGFQLLQIAFDGVLFFWCILFASVIGMLAGFFPAKDATKRQIVDAIRAK